MSDKFLPCSWSCRKCDQKGEVLPWVRLGESDDDAVWRHLVEIRGRCVLGCLYVAQRLEDGERDRRSVAMEPATTFRSEAPK